MVLEVFGENRAVPLPMLTMVASLDVVTLLGASLRPSKPMVSAK
jgi:hypothetical protein